MRSVDHGEPFTVVDAAGQPVAGELSEREGIAFFRPEKPWALGMTYTVNIPYDYDESQTVAAPFSVAPASTVALPVPAPQLMTRLQESLYHLYCTEADQQTIVARVLERLDAQVLLAVSSPPSTVDALSAQQLFLTPVIDGVALTAPVVGPYSAEILEPTPAPPRICAYFRGLDLRTMTASNGPETCIDSTLQAYKQEFDVEDALAVDVCPYPDAAHDVAWCTFNRAQCAGGRCLHYPQLCEGAPAVRDAGTPFEEDAGGPGAASGDASPEPAVATGRTDGGCQITARGPRPSAACLALLLAAIGLFRRRGRL